MIYAAAFLIIALAVAHSFLGERYILVRLFRRGTVPQLFGGTRFTTDTLRFAWHITTVAWLGLAALLLQAAQGQHDFRTVATTIGWTCIASGILPLVITRGRHLSWLVLFVIGGLSVAAGAN